MARPMSFRDYIHGRARTGTRVTQTPELAFQRTDPSAMKRRVGDSAGAPSKGPALAQAEQARSNWKPSAQLSLPECPF